MKKTKLIASLAITAIAAGAISAGAYTYYKTINVEPGPSLIIDDKAFVPKDVNGNNVETFIYNGTTYVPIRAISEAFDKDVNYNSLYNSVEITSNSIASKDFEMFYIHNRIRILSTDICGQIEKIWYKSSDMWDAYNAILPYHSSQVDSMQNIYNSQKKEFDSINTWISSWENDEYFSKYKNYFDVEMNFLETLINNHHTALAHFKTSAYGQNYAKDSYYNIKTLYSTSSELENSIYTCSNDEFYRLALDIMLTE